MLEAVSENLGINPFKTFDLPGHYKLPYQHEHKDCA
jgi:hypothetical protein